MVHHTLDGRALKQGTLHGSQHKDASVIEGQSTPEFAARQEEDRLSQEQID